MTGVEDMRIRTLNNGDIPKWWALSHEYDSYVKELVPDLTEWYDGNNKNSLSFDSYIKTKIDKQEAFIAVDEHDDCLGIVAISRENNRISFFGVSESIDFHAVGGNLMKYALENLDSSKPVSITELSSTSQKIQMHKELLHAFGFSYSCDSLENGAPVNVFVKPSLIKE